MVSRFFPGGYNVKLYISRGRLAWWLLAFLCCAYMSTLFYLSSIFGCVLSLVLSLFSLSFFFLSLLLAPFKSTSERNYSHICNVMLWSTLLTWLKFISLSLYFARLSLALSYYSIVFFSCVFFFEYARSSKGTSAYSPASLLTYAMWSCDWIAMLTCPPIGY